MDAEARRIRMREIEATKIADRAGRIDRLVIEAQGRGEDSDRLFWTIVHDLEHAPRTTNRRQLEALGFELPDPKEFPGLDPCDVADQLRSVLEGLSLIRVFICGSEHLSDRFVLEHLIRVVVDESVPDLPLSLTTRQWVDLSAVGRPEPDRRPLLQSPSSG